MPSMETVVWNVFSKSPLMQSCPDSMWAEPEEDPEDASTAKKTRRKKPMYGGQSAAFKQAADQLYLNDEGQNYHPGQAFWGSLLYACRERKLGSLHAETAVTIGVRVIEQEFLLYDPASLTGKRKPKPIDPKGWKVDKRRAVNHNKNASTGGVAVVAIRPIWKVWGGLLRLEIDADLFMDKRTRKLELGGLTDLLNIAGMTFGNGVGRRRIWTIRNRKEIWSDMGMGRYGVELRQ